MTESKKSNRLIHNAIKHGDLLSELKDFELLLSKSGKKANNFIYHILSHRYIVYKNSLANVIFLKKYTDHLYFPHEKLFQNKDKRVLELQIYVFNNVKINVFNKGDLIRYYNIEIIKMYIKLITIDYSIIYDLIHRFNIDFVKDLLKDKIISLKYKDILTLIFGNIDLLHLIDKTILLTIYNDFKKFINTESTISYNNIIIEATKKKVIEPLYNFLSFNLYNKNYFINNNGFNVLDILNYSIKPVIINKIIILENLLAL